MRWPLMLRRTHETVVQAINDAGWEAIATQARAHDVFISDLTDRYQRLLDAEFTRARDEGRHQVHRWAVEVNYNIFMGSHPWQGTQRQRATAALQEAESQFSPSRTQLTTPPAITEGE